MDTILYFYPIRQGVSWPASEFCWKEYKFPIYRLVKVGLTADAISLLQEAFEEGRGQGKAEWMGQNPKKHGRFKAFAVFGDRRKKKEWEKQRAELLHAIFGLWGEPCNSFCVCQNPVTYFNKWQFTDYREEKWVDYLMQHGNLPHYVVLGNAPCLWEVLPKYAKGMKSLRFFLKESEFNGELEKLAAFLFEEYGLASDIHFLEEAAGYKKLPFLGALPCNILDFSREEKVSCQAAPADSIWLDFDGLEEKRQRFELRRTRVQYFSLVKEWKFAIQFCTES